LPRKRSRALPVIARRATYPAAPRLVVPSPGKHVSVCHLVDAIDVCVESNVGRNNYALSIDQRAKRGVGCPNGVVHEQAGRSHPRLHQGMDNLGNCDRCKRPLSEMEVEAGSLDLLVAPFGRHQSNEQWRPRRAAQTSGHRGRGKDDASKPLTLPKPCAGGGR
jgi:hypothetical protein